MHQITEGSKMKNLRELTSLPDKWNGKLEKCLERTRSMHRESPLLSPWV